MSSTLRKQLQDNAHIECANGFSFDRPKMHRYNDFDAFATALESQKENSVRMNADFLAGVTIDGQILDRGMSETTGNLRLSGEAFGNLCHFAKVPVGFVKRVAKQNDSLAMDIMQDRIKHNFHDGQDKVLVIDTSANSIVAIVSSDTHQPLDNSDVLEMLTSSNAGLTFSNGWLEGSKARMTFKDITQPFQPAVGDVVHTGTAVTTGASGNGTQAVHVCDYTERLVCTNGLTAMDKSHSQRVPHIGDVQFSVAQAVMTSGQRSRFMIPLMESATSRFLNLDETRAVKHYVSQPQNGGSPTLGDKVAEYALAESRRYGRDAGACTLWDFVNGVTESAHDARTIHRRGELETMGFRVLSRFLG
jgi:hypothetical protein